MNTEVWMAIDTLDVLVAEANDMESSFLSAPERIRVAAILGLRRQSQFRAGRWLMRKLLARVHGGDPVVDWPLSAAVDSAPTFLGEAFAHRSGAQWQFSVSEAGHYVACAMSTFRLGIDMEVPERERDLLTLGDVLCNPDEMAQLRALKPAARQNYFLSLWALKEAAIKREAGRSGSAALRKLATREITTGDLSHLVSETEDAEAARDGDAAADFSATELGSPCADAWTWQSPGLTLAVVTEQACAVPQWAMPPPDFMLFQPSRWSVTMLPSAPPVPALAIRA